MARLESGVNTARKAPTAFAAVEAIATGRPEALFSEAVAQQRDRIADAVAGRRILVIGGAGSIGSATVRALIPFRPGRIIVVDTNENNLAELIRDLRSTFVADELPELLTVPVDFGSETFLRLLLEHAPCDMVLNFAAIKHVRSEKDTCSVLQMFDNNVLKVARLMRWVGDVQPGCRFFSVSTDKAANPVNLMGASKRVMEHVMFSPLADRLGADGRVTSARFANVAFSDGSLLDGWLRRFAKGQPLACPAGVRRYFISLREAGQICLLASTVTDHRHVVVPDFDAQKDLVDVAAVARGVIAQRGFAPREYEDESAARANMASDVAAGAYPLVLTPLDTDGETPFEEFIGAGEEVKASGFPWLRLVVPTSCDETKLAAFIQRLEEVVGDAMVSIRKEDIVSALSDLVPEFRHAQRGKSLDDRA